MHTATLHGAHATGAWIGMDAGARGRSAPLLRRSFALQAPATAAQLDICGLGYYEAWINGRRVGDHVLDPAQTDYDQRAFYVRHDVTALLGAGENVIAVMLGDGWYNQDRIWAGAHLAYGPPRLWAALRCSCADGRTALVASDARWRCSAGPVTENNIYAGETYDARLEQPGWCAPGFNDAHWQPVVLMEPPDGRLEEQRMPPIRMVEELRPVRIAAQASGIYIADLGQNIAGWARMRVTAPRGTEVQLRFAEELHDDGSLDPESTGVFATGVVQTDRYICRGDGVEVWEPRFTYHGFRYIEVRGWPGVPAADDITGVVVHTDLSAAGGFVCSDQRLNRLHQMALWTHRGNVHSVPEDCPARERCGWLGDANMVAEYSLWNFDSRAFWEKYLGDIETTRARHGGLLCNIAPGKRTCGPAKSDWAAVYVMLPWYLYLHTGDTGVVQRHWEGMSALMRHYAHQAQHWLLTDGYGDWCDVGDGSLCNNTPPALTSSMWFCRCAHVMAKMAQDTRQTADAARYDAWIADIRAAIVAHYYDHARGTFGSQTADTLALQFEIVPPGETERVVQSLADDIRRRDMHVSVGIMGLRYIFEVLSRHGHGALAMALMHQDSYPSFGDLLRRGATTPWETWGEEIHDRTHGVRSCNHPMKGGYDNWFYTSVAGLVPDEAQPGFMHFYLQPLPPPGLAWAHAWHTCPHGRISSAWRYDNRRFSWDVTVPDGCRATAILPFSRRQLDLDAGLHHFTDHQPPP